MTKVVNNHTDSSHTFSIFEITISEVENTEELQNKVLNEVIRSDKAQKKDKYHWFCIKNGRITRLDFIEMGTHPSGNNFRLFEQGELILKDQPGSLGIWFGKGSKPVILEKID